MSAEPVDGGEIERRPTVQFNHHFGSDGIQPDEAYAQLRKECPVAWSEEHGGYWIVSSHEYATKVFKDQTTFSTVRNPDQPELTRLSVPPSPFDLQVPEELEPPEFLLYRRLLNGILSMRKVAEEGGLQARLRYFVDWYIDQFIETGRSDFVYELTSPVMGATILGWLGFPAEDWERISHTFHDAVGYPPDSERAKQAFEDMSGYQERRLHEEIAVRQAELAEGKFRGDVMSYFLSQEIDGVPMAPERAAAMVRLLIAGGVDTTVSVSTSTLVHLYRHPEQRAELIEHPELWETAVDEFLRRYPPALAHGRTVAADVELGGCQLRAGDALLVSEGAACWDPDEFPQPMEVMLDRFPNRHLAFGLGAHRCPGMHLARFGIRQMVSRVLERMPDYEIDEQALQKYANQAGMTGWRSALATFTPGERVLSPSSTPPPAATSKET